MRLILAVFAVLALTPATMAQVVSERDVTAQPTYPEPDNGDIAVKFGGTVQIYFKHAIKSIRLDDQLSVSAIPRTDHIVAFTGLAPGKSTVILEGTDGQMRNWGTVTVIREAHEVKLYLPPSRLQGSTGSSGPGGITIINQSGPIATADTPSADYRSIICDGVSCSQPAPPR